MGLGLECERAADQRMIFPERRGEQFGRSGRVPQGRRGVRLSQRGFAQRELRVAQVRVVGTEQAHQYIPGPCGQLAARIVGYQTPDFFPYEVDQAIEESRSGGKRMTMG